MYVCVGGVFFLVCILAMTTRRNVGTAREKVLSPIFCKEEES